MLATISTELIEIIRKEVKKSRSRYQVARELNVSYKKVLRYAKNIRSERGIPQDVPS